MQSVFLNGRFLDQPVTGVQRFSTEIAAAIDRLVAEGNWPETTVLAPPQRTVAAPREALDRRGIDFHQLRFKVVGRMRGHLWEQTELPGAARGGVLLSLGNTAPVLAGRRQVVVIHDAGVFDTPESYSLRFRTWYKTLHHGLARTGAQVVTVSDFSRQRIAARLGLNPKEVAVINEGAEHILRSAADSDTLARHGLKPRAFALVVGSSVAHKNLAVLDHAAALLEQRGMVIAVAGGIDRQVFRRNRGAGFVQHHLGRVTDAELRALYENAVCLLFPSRYEGFGLPPIEAMACGCPVLAARGGAVEEICQERALYFVNGDSRSLVQALKRLLDDPGLADDLRGRGLVGAAGVNWTASAHALGDVVRRLH